MSRATRRPEPEGEPWALAPQAATQGHTGALLRRIAELHTDAARVHQGLAECYDDLAAQAEHDLAESQEQSVHALVPEPEFLTTRDVADLLQVSPRTVRRMAADGRLPTPVEITESRARWRRADVDAHFGEERSK